MAVFFPLRLVQSFDNNTNLWRARRCDGEPVAEASLVADGSGGFTLKTQAKGDAARTADLAAQALSSMAQRFVVDDAIGSLLNAGIEMQLLHGHQFLVDGDGRRLRLCCDTAGLLGIPHPEANETARAFGLLLALGQYAVLAQHAGDSLRGSLHRVLDLYARLERGERGLILHLLGSSHLDSGNLFGLFLRKAGHLDAADPGRDLQITWLLGHERIDLPYDRQAVIETLHSDIDPDQKRFALFTLLRGYDRDLEGGNIARLAAAARQAGQQVVFGRMSRAFHNQATLFADAVTILPQPGWADLARRVEVSADGSQALQPHAQALRLLLQNPEPVPLIQLEGACERFEEEALEEQKRQTLAFLAPARRALEEHSREQTIHPIHAPGSGFAASGIQAAAAARLEAVEAVRLSLLQAPKHHAAYVIVSQRPSPTGSHLLAKINEFEDPYLGKAENLRKLARLAGDRVYSSPDYRWLETADHWIEAIPLFIKEEILVEDGQERTRTVIDIAGMEESFREEMADHWARNIRRVWLGDMLCLARQLVDTGALDAQAPADEGKRLERLQSAGSARAVADIGRLLAGLYDREAGRIHALVESEEATPLDAARRVLAATDAVQALDPDDWSASACAALEGMPDAPADDLEDEALAVRRPLPTLHVLTTQSAGMTEGYIRTWLEESMALHNVVEAHGLQTEVNEQQAAYTHRLRLLGERVIQDLGIWVEVEEAAAREQIEIRAAVAGVLNANGRVRAEVALLAVLLEIEADSGPVDYTAEPRRAVAALERARPQLEEAALAEVETRNGHALAQTVAALIEADGHLSYQDALRRAVETDQHYRADLETYLRFSARRRALEEWRAERPELHLDEQVSTYLRRYQRLGKTTARKEVLLRHGLNPETLDPRHYYRATGGGKRFHLLYTPSRVDLGERERESVESWAQWVGGADREAAAVGRQIYGLINKNVRSFDSLSEPEVLKTGENASMASHFAFSNALSLMVTAARHGDIEAMGDQMSRRKDRLIHPAGEAYGGYCVPKDGLFLEFVLTLGRDEKLRQLGLSAADHPGVVALARHLLERRGDFAGQLEWEAWAAGKLADRDELTELFSLRGDTPVFQITRIAHVLDNLGQPELRDPDRLGTSLAARWGIHKMVAGGEHVNRFMPFFKAWLVRRGMRRAADLNPGRPIDPERFVAVLSAEYKPDTQDGRFAAGLRKFEILAGTGGHLLYALDAEGQELALLLHEGFEGLQRRGKGGDLARRLGATDDNETRTRLATLFPAYAPPAELRVVSPTGLSTQDLLSYTGDTDLEGIAESVRQRLQQAGFADGEIDANMQVHGPDIRLWDHLAPIDDPTKEALQEELDGRIHALHLAVVGPEPSYLRALQGADVLDTGIPHRELLELLGDPARVCDLMLAANPNSALVLVDGASGARRRALNRLDVMLWFAAAERPAVGAGRQAVYTGIGLGEETVESWRRQMQRQKRRAAELGQAVIEGRADEAHSLFARLQTDLRREQEAQEQLAENEKLARFGRDRPRDRHIGRCMARLAGDCPLSAIGFDDFLSLGGLFLLNGLPEDEIRAYRRSFSAGLRAMGGNNDDSDETSLPDLLHPAFQLEVEDFREEKGIESSNKAAEERPAVALEARSQLAARIAQARALHQRQQAFAAVAPCNDFDRARDLAMEALGDGDRSVDEEAFGRFLGQARQALLALGREVYGGEDQEDADAFAQRISLLFNGRDIDLEDWRQVAGGYEDIGDFGRLAQHIDDRARHQNWDKDHRQQALERVAAGGELFYILLALEQTAPFTRDEEQDSAALWRALADFFAETLNDHFYAYRPWLYARGVGFATYEGEDLYRLANRHHAWLYRYLRGIVERRTEAANLPAAERDLLLGNYLDGNAIEAIGAGGDGLEEKVWRSYGQLRELAFMRNDGFPLPVVFAEFDPDLIDADRRVNHVIAVPTGRTHYSRALAEGPTLSRQLQEEGRPGANLIISRFVELAEDKRFGQRIARLHSGHLYLDAATYAAVLQRHKGLSATAAAEAAAAIPPKGVRVAAAFTRPLLAAAVYPFHGDPHYTSGAYEDCGLPYTVQSLFHTWTTYDKAKYPDIFPPESGVEIPGEIDWLASYTAADPSGARRAIEHGLEGTPYPGLRHFAAEHRIIMVKDAAESGGRNAGAFVLRGLDGDFDETQVEAAVEFILQISRKNNVAIQEVVVSSPEYWASEAFMQRFVRRQITDWQSPVDRHRQPRTPIYGSHRIILTTPDPAAGNWNISHWIALSSKQLITNVGRGGTLEEFLPEHIRPEHRQTILERLESAGRRVMQALADYEGRAAETYQRESGRPVGTDLTGVSYGVPRYMMLDFLVTPVFADAGTLADIAPEFDEAGQRQGSAFVLRDGDRLLHSQITDWRVVLIEPNIGVGLWDRVALRETERETERAAATGDAVDWQRVGANARIVLADLSRAGEDYLKALGTL